jgi:predicted ATPase
LAKQQRKADAQRDRLAETHSEIRELSPRSAQISRLPTNLKLPHTRLVGRVGLLEVLDDHLEGDAPLITLCGPAGVGKTRVATECLRERLTRDAQQYPGGIWHAELTEVDDIDGICAALASAMDIPLSREHSDHVVALAEAFKARGATIVLIDDAEHVATPLAAALAHWLAQTSGARFMVTSRVRLGLEGEQVIDVPPMRREGVELFVARARLVRHDYDPSDEERVAIKEVVRRLDGIPLAIELAASRVRVLSARQIAEHLGNRFSLLVSRDTKRHPRRGTMRGAIEWSWRLLAPPQQTALAQCSVFRGGFDLDAATEVLELFEPHLSERDHGPAWVLDVLQSLCDSSLVESYDVDGAAMRYRLFESVRDYAAEQLSELGETDTIQERHDKYFVDFAQSAVEATSGRGARAALAALAVEQDNLRAVHSRALRAGRADRALGVALALTPLLLARGPHDSLLELLDDAIACDPVVEALGGTGQVQIARAQVLEELGRGKEALQARRRALRMACSVSDPKLEGRALSELAKSACAQGQLDWAAELHRCGLELHRRTGDLAFEGRTMARRGAALALQGAIHDARDQIRDAVLLLREHGAPAWEAEALAKLGRLEHDLGRRADARDLYRRALALLQAVGDRRQIGNVILNLGSVALELGEIDEAETAFDAALSLCRQIGNRRSESLALSLLAQCKEARGESDLACDLFRDALALLAPSAEPRLAGLAACWRGRLEADRDEIEAAQRYLDEGARSIDLLCSSGVGLVPRLCHAHLELALSRRAMHDGRLGEAAEHLGRAQRGSELDANWGIGGGGVRSSDARMALARLRSALSGVDSSPFGAVHVGAEDRATLPSPPPGAVTSWGISRCGRTFVLPNGAESDLSTRRAPRLILKALADAREHRPGEALTRMALLEAGWPGEKLMARAAASRVHTAVATLRRMGLKPLLLRRDDGYLLDPEQALQRY